MEYLPNMGTTANQLKILQQLSKFEAMADVFAEQMSNINNVKSCSCKTTSSAIEDVYVDSIDTVQQLEAFEQKLRDKDNMKENVKKLANVCGNKGNGNGINNCYLLVDRLFTRKLMTLCSWAGGARGEGEKVAFKTFKNVISLFYNVVHLSDDSFTQKDCEDFFKNVIRNSTRRNKSTLSRISTIKRRSKKNTSETIEENEENEVENINESERNIVENGMEETEQNKPERIEENEVIIEEVCKEQDIEFGDVLHDIHDG
uniref:Uncharacterized protein LOC114334910 n=1 Tax=Diabrotica virgifera virgifera TaxID=50390 RepID=A0A6P7G1D7_DIAVI